MKKQTIRRLIQMIFLALTGLAFFVNFQFAMGFIMIMMILGGAFYCGYVCPYGTLQELAAKLAKRLGIKQKKMPRPVHKYLKFARYGVFLLVMLVNAGWILNVLSFEPRSNFIGLLMGNGPSLIALAVIVTFILISIVYERLYCNYLCYEGAKYGLLSIFRPVTITRDSDKCIDCKKCDKTCVMNIEVSKFKVLRSPSCINCFECLDACPVDDTLTYRFAWRNILNIRYAAMVMTILLAVGGYLFLNDGSDGHHDTSSQVDQELTDQVAETGGIVKSQSSDEVLADKAQELPVQTQGQSSLYKDGVYEGSARGFNGMIYVSVTIEKGNISQVKVTDHRDDRKWYNRAYSIVDEIINQQSTNVDLVSGATYSSRGIRDAVADALEKAK